ncbi:MAG: metal-dependent hydrolase, partial [Cyanobacteria bacterium J06641_5]
MMAVTHMVVAAAGTTLILSDVSPATIAVTVAASQLPDLDTTQSLAGQLLLPVSSYIEETFGHRSITHSLLLTGALGAIAGGMVFLGLPWKPCTALPIAHLLTILSDSRTKQGIQLMWPSNIWYVWGRNPNRRIATGSAQEYWLLVLFIALLALSIFVQLGPTSGSVFERIGQLTGYRNTVVKGYFESEGYEGIATLEGVFTSDRSSATGEYLVVDGDGRELIVADSEDRIYRTGTQIVGDLSTRLGAPATTQEVAISLSEEDIAWKLQQLRQQYPRSRIFLSGTLSVDFIDEVHRLLNPDPRQYETIVASNNAVVLEWAPLDRAATV